MQQHLETLVGRRVLLFDSLGTLEEKSERLGDVEIPQSVTEAVSGMLAATDCSKDIVAHDLRGSAWLVRPVSANTAEFGVIAVDLGHPAKGKILLSVNGTERQKGDLSELIWSVPEIVWKLSQQVEIGAGDIIMTGTPSGVAALSPGDEVECGVDGVGALKVSIGKAAA